MNTMRRTKKLTTLAEFEAKTAILPSLMAETIAAGRLKSTEEFVQQVVDRVLYYFDNHPQFRRRVLSDGNRGRDWIWMFVNHWCEAYEKRNPQQRRLTIKFDEPVD